jgi:transposase
MGAVIELTDDEWGLVKDLFDPAVHRGVKGTIAKREIVDAILWLARTGCQWRHLPDRFPDWQAVWSQWRRWRDNGTWAAAMRVLAREIRLRHKRKADPTMVMIDGQTVKGGRAGPTFHEAGGRGGYTRGAKRTILIEILGLPLAVSVESAKPHDVQSARRILKDQLDAPPAQQPKLPGLQAIVADRGYTGLAALAHGHGLALDIKRPPAAPMLPPAKPGGKPRRASAPSRRSTRSRTSSPASACGGGCRAATSRPRSAPRLGSRWHAWPTSADASASSRRSAGYPRFSRSRYRV